MPAFKGGGGQRKRSSRVRRSRVRDFKWGVGYKTVATSSFRKGSQVKSKRLLAATAVLATLIPTTAMAATITINESDLTDTNVVVSESNNNRDNDQTQTAVIDQSNDQEQTVDQSSGGSTHQTGLANVNAPVKAAVPVQTGPIEVLTTKTNTIDQAQTYTDNSTYEDNDPSTLVNRSVVGGSVITASDDVELAHDDGSDVGSRTRTIVLKDSFTASGKTLPLTGTALTEPLLWLGGALILVGAVLYLAGLQEILSAQLAV